MPNKADNDMQRPIIANNRGAFLNPMQERINDRNQPIKPGIMNGIPKKLTRDTINPASPHSFFEGLSGCTE